MLRETVITFEVLSVCRNQDRDYVCGEKVAELFVSDQCVADQLAEESRHKTMKVVNRGRCDRGGEG